MTTCRIIAFVVLQLLDVIMTKIIISNGGTEVAPVGAIMVNYFGIDSLFTLKIICTFVVVPGIVLIHRKQPSTGNKCLRFANISVASVVIYSSLLLICA